MSFISRVIATWCNKHGNGYPPATCNEDYGFVPIASMEGDDDDDGGYDYAPAA